MYKDLPHIIPAPQPEVEENFALYHTTYQFYQEVQARSEFKRHCEWYHTIAEQNRRDLERMRGELNIMRWFYRRQ